MHQGEEVGDAFFAALERVRAIHANCRALLRTHHQRAGLELMDAMSGFQETAYERLCRCAAARRRFRPVPGCECSKVNIHSLGDVCTGALQEQTLQEVGVAWLESVPGFWEMPAASPHQL